MEDVGFCDVVCELVLCMWNVFSFLVFGDIGKVGISIFWVDNV